MKEEDIHVPSYKSPKKYSSYIGEVSPPVENLLKRDFHVDAPNEKWLTDITEFHIPAGKVYLSPIIDCFDGIPVSWTLTQQFATIDFKIMDESRGEYVRTPNPTKIVIEPYILSPIGQLFMIGALCL